MSKPSANYPKLTVVLTAYNEENSLENSYRSVITALDGAVSDYEIIIIDDLSSDRSPAIADTLAKKYPRTSVVHHKKNLNQGGCYKESIGLARGEYHCLLSGDDMIDAASLHSLFKEIGRADLNLIFVDNPESRSLPRRFVSWLFVKILRLLFGYKLKYFNGPIVARTDLLKTIEISSSFMFISDAVIKLLDRGSLFTVTPMRMKQKVTNFRAIKRNILPISLNLLRLFWALRLKFFIFDKRTYH